MSGGKSKDTSSSFQSTQNIAAAFLANLFGQGAGFDKEGLVFTPTGSPGGTAGGASGLIPGAPGRDARGALPPHVIAAQARAREREAAARRGLGGFAAGRLPLNDPNRTA